MNNLQSIIPFVIELIKKSEWDCSADIVLDSYWNWVKLNISAPNPFDSLFESIRLNHIRKVVTNNLHSIILLIIFIIDLIEKQVWDWGADIVFDSYRMMSQTQYQRSKSISYMTPYLNITQWLTWWTDGHRNVKKLLSKLFGKPVSFISLLMVINCQWIVSELSVNCQCQCH